MASDSVFAVTDLGTSIDTSEITDGAVTTAKIAASAVTPAKLDTHYVQLVSETVLGSAAASITFSSLDSDTDDNYLLILTAPAGDGNQIRIFFNGDETASNYYTQRLEATSSTVTGTRYNLPLLGAAGGSGTSIVTEISVHNSKAIACGFQVLNAASSVTWEARSVKSVNNADPITSIKIAKDSGNLPSGTTARLYRRGIT